MAIDIRAVCGCSLGTLISAQISDDYIQGQGLIRTQGSCEIKGIITPSKGTTVTFTYTKGGITRQIPRQLKVLSSFADPFRGVTKVELGCPLTIAAEKKEQIKWRAFDEPGYNEFSADDGKIVTIPIRAAAVAAKCVSELGITPVPTPPLTNWFSIATFDLSPGYFNVLSDLLVSECLAAYVGLDDKLKYINLSARGGTGPVLNASRIIDAGPIGAGRVDGDAVVVSYSTLILKEPDETEIAPDEEEQKKQNWEEDETIGPVTDVTVPNPWYDQNPWPFSVPESFTYTYTPRTVTRTEYDEWDRVIKRTETEYTILAAIAPAFCQSRPTMNGNGSSERVITKTETTTYRLQPTIKEVLEDGSVVYVEPPDGYQDIIQTESEVVEPIEKLVSSVGISGQAIVYIKEQVLDGLGVIGGPSLDQRLSNAISEVGVFGLTGTVKTERTTVEPERGTSIVDTNVTKTKTTNYKVAGYSQRGQQALAIYLQQAYQREGFWGDGVAAALTMAKTMMLDGVQTQITTGRDIALQQRPSAADRINKANAKEDEENADPNNGYSTEASSEIELASGTNTGYRTDFMLPYAPDDRFTKVGTGANAKFYAVKSDAKGKAANFGRAQNKLLQGNRYGLSLQLAPEDLPSQPFSPFVVCANGVCTLYRTNAISWTMSAEGVIASTDALFWGAVGGAGTTWVPVAPGITTLPALPPTVDTTPTVVRGSLATLGGDVQSVLTFNFPSPADGDGVLVLDTQEWWIYDTPTGLWANVGTTPGPTMTVATVVPAANEILKVQATLRTGLSVRSLPYALDPTTTVPPISTRIGATVRKVTAVNVPMATTTITALAPQVAIGAAVRVPVATTTTQALAPVIATGASVAVPVATTTTTALAPDVQAGNTEILVPAAVTTTTAVPPSIEAGAPADDYYSNMATQLFTALRDWRVDWWGD